MTDYTQPHNARRYEKQPRWHSIHVLEDPPGLPHAHDCPCCLMRQRLEWACKEVHGMRAARIRDQLIVNELERQGFSSYMIETALSS